MIELLKAVYTSQILFSFVELAWNDEFRTKDFFINLIPGWFIIAKLKEKL